MVKTLTSVEEYADFIHEINSDETFRSPRRRTDAQLCGRLADAANKPAHTVLGVFEEGRITGLFAFLEEEDESYLEMLEGLSRRRNAYEEMLAYLKAEYAGYQADFVFNPKNSLLYGLLKAENTEFDTEQMKMVLEKEVPYQGGGRQIQLYSPPYREQYASMHNNNRYWTGDKVLEAPERFRVILAVEDGEAVGYIDVTYTYDENEPFDVFVKEEYRKKGYGKAMLAKAIELNRPHGMALQVDVDNAAAIALYKSMGFSQAAGENSMTAHTSL